METLLIILLVLFLVGGGGWGYSRWRSQIGRSQNECMAVLYDRIRGIYGGSSTLKIDPRTLFQAFLN